MTPLVPPFAHFMVRIEDPVHRAHRAQIAIFIQQGRTHLGRRLVHEALAMEQVEDFLSIVASRIRRGRETAGSETGRVLSGTNARSDRTVQ